MNKLKLDLDDVQVESFPVTDDGQGSLGTVHGHITLNTCEDSACCTPNPTCPESAYTNCDCDSVDDYTCGGSPTCFYTSCGSCRDC